MTVHNCEEEMYLDLMYSLTEKLKSEKLREDRTKVGCVSSFGNQLRFNLENKFPLLTTKRVWWKGVAEELFWFLRGETNIKSLQDKGVHIWDEWASVMGNLGPVYGSMWRSWPDPSTVSEYRSIDQLKNIILEIKENPNSRRLVVSSWNPSYLPDPNLSSQRNVEMGLQALPPCHCLFQFFVEDGHLDCQLYQRSADIFLGVPFNIASYSLLTYIIADICDLKPREFIHTFGDIHLYSNHLEAAQEQLSRESKEFPKLNINRKLTIDDLEILTLDDFEIVGYDPHPTIKAPIAV